MQSTPGALGELSGPELEFFALTRLERFAFRLADPSVQQIPVWRRLAQHATSLAIADCLALGLQEETLVILEDAFGDLAGAPAPVVAIVVGLWVALSADGRVLAR
jgi:hypothetical protein